MVLPEIIQKVVKDSGKHLVPNDTVYEELKKLSNTIDVEDEDLAISMAIYMLGFADYHGFIK